MLSERVKELAAKQPLKAVEFEPEADPPSMKLLYKDGSVETITLGMHMDEVRAKVRDTYKYDPYFRGYAYDGFPVVPFSFYYDPIKFTLTKIVFGDIDHHGKSEEVIRALEVKAYFRRGELLKDLLETPKSELDDWFESEADLSPSYDSGLFIEEIGFLVNFLKDQKRASDIAMGYPCDENI
ncbi:hypothetical protein ACQ4M4_10990 [Leptolyngbya sp. AN02str]|uniref:hypothetical protein n=1 Tax=Leptolyngbya sp. AN02str TaxID=3423363 RepID=UPI003D321981